ncbi:hypothetical protein Pla163_06620 [Planctomycetes bacterium Pla163]|uniref:Uncharacterized protein n=1 Tax=Rohdeia mirabilis TaxID=2528008 RepID=A0A518CWH7_9BACT|nr:hypothetical protein Pla163_06620 [Planctomycetes bacterium Pla163]
MDDRVHVFGIRHHGPGSSASLLNALERLRPTAVLVELPADVEPALEYAAAPGMVPPVALLAHDAKRPDLARFYPFAEWSPEWQALRWAAANGADVAAIDLPCGIAFKERLTREEADAARAAVPDEESTGEDSSDQDGDEDVVDERRLVAADPLDHLAALAGRTDGEAWWDAVVERAENPPEVFAAIALAMGTLRESLDRDLGPLDPTDESESGRTRHFEQLREAHMRQAIRDALRSTEGPVAVVVGAWHAPALTDGTTATSDRATLKGRRPSRIEVTWVPWTDQRLALRSGYGAGVRSPAWYRHLWQRRKDSTSGDAALAVWMARAASVLRDEGLGASTASAIDATGLARTLATLRGHARPGLEEVRDACLGAMCHGDPIPLRVVERRLILGESLGEIDERVPRQPLAADLERIARRLRLVREELPRDIALDLRTDAGRAKSVLFHRLLLLRLDWPVLLEREAGRGTYRERWRLQWRPELEVALAEALRFGTTIETAAQAAACDSANQEHRLGDLAELVDRALCADLAVAAREAIKKLQWLAADSSDVVSTMAAIGPLGDTLRYGSSRGVDLEALRTLLESLAALVTAGLPHAVRGIDHDSAARAGNEMAAFDGALRKLELEDLLERWRSTLSEIAEQPLSAPFTMGVATRRLADDGHWDGTRVGNALGRALSTTSDPNDAAAWLEGFFLGDVQVLLHDDAVLERLGAWVARHDAEVFDGLLPVLRRTFADFEAAERRQLFRAVTNPNRARGADVPTTTTTAAFEAALPGLAVLLGLDLEELGETR